MPRSDREWAGDILAAIAEIRDDARTMDFRAFAANPPVVRSILYSIGVIGEAAKHRSEAFKLQHSDVPWRAIARMRDRVVHEYFRTAVNRAWEP